MFIKVIGPNGESLYQCKRVHIKPVYAGEGLPHTEIAVLFDLEGDCDKDFISLRLEKKSGTCLFIMSDEGKTIDRYNLGQPINQ